MNLGDFSSLATFASNPAVLISLLFLGLQVRQGNRNQRSLMQQGRSGRNAESLTRLSEPGLAKVMSLLPAKRLLANPVYRVGRKLGRLRNRRLGTLTPLHVTPFPNGYSK